MERRTFSRRFFMSSALVAGAVSQAGCARGPRPGDPKPTLPPGPWKFDAVLWDRDRWAAGPLHHFHRLDNGGVALRIWSRGEQGYANDIYHEQSETFALHSTDGGFTWSRYAGSLPEEKELRLRDGTLVEVYTGGGMSLEEKRKLLASVGANPATARMRGADLWPASHRAELERAGRVVEESFPGIVGTHTSMSVARSTDGGKTYENRRIENLMPFSRVYGPFRRPLELRDGTIVAACTGRRVRTDGKPEPYTGPEQGSPEFAFVLRSTDKGVTWSSHTIAEDRTFKLQFNETEVLQLPDGRILAMMRCHKFRDHVGNYLFQSYSQDGGVTWTAFKRTPIWGYPPQLILLKSGAVLCTYAHRRHPYGVRACLSRDLGETWDYENEKIIRDDSLPGLVQYPISIQVADETILTAYAISKIPRIPYREDDQVSPDKDLLVHRAERMGPQQRWAGGYHGWVGLSRYTENYVRAPGQTTSTTLWHQKTGDREE